MTCCLAKSSGTNALATGDSYSASETFDLPIDLEGDFFVLVRTDASDLVLEAPFDNNNDLAASAITTVSLSPVADLAVTSVDAPDDATSGQPVTISWTVQKRWRRRHSRQLV